MADETVQDRANEAARHLRHMERANKVIETQTKRIAALKLELAEAKEYTQRLRTTLADVLTLLPDGEMKAFAAKVLAGEIR